MNTEYTSVRITTEVHRQIKALAALKGKTVTELVDEACRAQLPPEPLLPWMADDNGHPPASP